MTITPQQIEKALGTPLNAPFLARRINDLIHAGLLVEFVSGRDGRYIGVAGDEEVPDWPIESMMPRRPGRVIIPTPTADGMDAEGDEECAVADPEIGTWALDAEIDRIRVEQMNAIFASLSVFRDRLTEVEERIRHLDEQVSGNMDDVITRTDPLEARVAALEKRPLSHVISGAGGTVVYPSGGGVGLWM